ncbi:class C sortase [Enterococcus hirae]|uniref:class C sortase n=1 Tax=Enterococcus hirae TaxID=1354 RepID=UPI001597898C|nr:class C sortase [Enterococcus hirae]QKX69333.1 class C sortase [Enterococcus hirae]
MSNKKRRYLDSFMTLLFITGIVIFMYPFVSDRINDYLDQQIIRKYQQQAQQQKTEELEKIQQEYLEKNRELAKSNSSPGSDPFSEEEPEKVTQSTIQKHTIGVLSIPKINVRLPIFDQTTSFFLEKGASLLAGTSYPVGGESTHAVLSSHRGLPKAKLFTDLDQLEKNDLFFIESQNGKLAYQVDQIKIIEPTDLDDLMIEKGQDLVTLLTCTPYMVNSHRLLVRGHRIPYEDQDIEKEVKKIDSQKKRSLLILGFVLIGLLVVGIVCFICYFKH